MKETRARQLGCILQLRSGRPLYRPLRSGKSGYVVICNDSLGCTVRLGRFGPKFPPVCMCGLVAKQTNLHAGVGA